MNQAVCQSQAHSHEPSSVPITHTPMMYASHRHTAMKKQCASRRHTAMNQAVYQSQVHSHEPISTHASHGYTAMNQSVYQSHEAWHLLLNEINPSGVTGSCHSTWVYENIIYFYCFEHNVPCSTYVPCMVPANKRRKEGIR